MERSTLDRLHIGATAIVAAPTRINPTILRLLEMGLTAGARVTLTRRAPMADPIELEVRGTRLCVRRADAACFPVQPVAPGDLRERAEAST